MWSKYKFYIIGAIALLVVGGLIYYKKKKNSDASEKEDEASVTVKDESATGASKQPTADLNALNMLNKGGNKSENYSIGKALQLVQN